jgi:hypothetical protein
MPYISQDRRDALLDVYSTLIEKFSEHGTYDKTSLGDEEYLRKLNEARDLINQGLALIHETIA